MSVRKIGFVGLRAVELNSLRRVLEIGLELHVTDAVEGKVGYDLPDGTRVEAYGASDAFHSFFTTGPVVGFAVDEFEACRQRLVNLGVEFVSDVQRGNGKAWVHFRLPDGTVAEIIGPE